MSVGRLLTLGLGTPFSDAGFLVTLGLNTAGDTPTPPTPPPVVPSERTGGGGGKRYGSAKITSRAREELEKLLALYDENLELVESKEVIAEVKEVVKQVENVAKTAKALRSKSSAPVYERINWNKIELDQEALRKIEAIIAQHLEEIDDDEVLLLT